MTMELFNHKDYPHIETEFQIMVFCGQGILK